MLLRLANLTQFDAPRQTFGLLLGVLVASCCFDRIAVSSCHAEEISNVDFFESKIRPMLIEHCYECHSIESSESGGNLRLDTSEATRRGGDRGAAVVPGNVDASLLLKAVSYADPDMEMPPSGKISNEEIEQLRNWIASGAFDPRVDKDDSAGEKKPSPMDRSPESHWAYVAPERANFPSKIRPDAADGIDVLFLEAGSVKGLSPSPVAERSTLIRRLYFDLTGLVPSEILIAEFVSDRHPLAYERLVDRLLASPEFGERFGRHWMDVARYADTVGYDFGGKDRRLVGSERFRDWSIRSFNVDMPYDEMIRNQLSGDRTDPDNANGNLDAMGFLTVGRKFQNRNDLIDDRIDVITRGLLGVTVACARCHDHKFDPVPTKDYYALAGILMSSVAPENGASPLMMKDSDKPQDERVMLRGQPNNRGEIAPRQFLTALRKPGEPRFNDGSGRAELVERIVAPDNPLTYRVMTNRVWSQLIGVPLVATPSDFGFRTEPPAVPAVLDDLALDLSQHKSIKRLVRRIVMSTTYRRSTQTNAEALDLDPENRYAMRGQRRRRDFESLRDSMLEVSGAMERLISSEPIDISVVGSRPRRSVYAFIDRQNLPGVFRTFDVASPDTHTPSRHYTTVPQQALYLLNSPLVVETAITTAGRVTSMLGESSTDAQRFAEAMFLRILGRRGTNAELIIAEEFLRKELNAAGPIPAPQSLWNYGLATIDESGFVKKLETLATFQDKAWQYSSTYPDPAEGYARLADDHGHPGNGKTGAVVRRWKTPGSGTIHVNAFIGHKQDQGDGIRVTFAIGEKVQIQTAQKNGERFLEPMSWPIKNGEFLDLIVDDNGSTSHDSFTFRTRIRFEGDDGRIIEANSVDDFSGPSTAPHREPMTRQEQLAQLLLISNEFAFVD